MQPRLLLAALASTTLTVSGGVMAAYQTGLLGAGRDDPAERTAAVGPPVTVVTTREVIDYVTTPASQTVDDATLVQLTVPPTTVAVLPTGDAPAPKTQLVATWTPGAAVAPVDVPSSNPQPVVPAAAPHASPAAPSLPPPPSSSPSSSPRAPQATPTTTTSPAPPSIAPTTTWPRGTEIPSDWPPGRPIPPIPAGCREPHLEDSGVWNCEH